MVKCYSQKHWNTAKTAFKIVLDLYQDKARVFQNAYEYSTYTSCVLRHI